MSVRSDSVDAKIISSLWRREVDGDFSIREMAERLDVRPYIGKLCDSVLRYAKGFVNIGLAKGIEISIILLIILLNLAIARLIKKI